MKFATKHATLPPTHFTHVATLPFEIKNSNLLEMWKKNANKLHFIPSEFVIHSQILIFSVFKIASLSPYLLQIKFSMSQWFYYLPRCIECRAV